MSRKRLISPAFFTNVDLFEHEASTGLPLRIAFAGLWTVADRRGIFPWTRSIKPLVIPYDSCDVLACLDALETAGFVRSYVVDGRQYGIIPRFADHQTFHVREKASKDPGPPREAPGQHSASTGLGSDKAVPSPTGTGTGTGTGTASTATTPPSARAEVPKGGWPARVAEAWVRAVGVISEGQVGRTLHPWVRLYPSPADALPGLLAAVEIFAKLEAARADGKTAGWPTFVREIKGYVPATMLPPARSEVA